MTMAMGEMGPYLYFPDQRMAIFKTAMLAFKLAIGLVLSGMLAYGKMK